jgi:hypothetical protein
MASHQEFPDPSMGHSSTLRARSVKPLGSEETDSLGGRAINFGTKTAEFCDYGEQNQQRANAEPTSEYATGITGHITGVTFSTITSDDWKRSLRTARATTNSVVAQIRAAEGRAGA